MSRQVLARMTRFHVRTSADRPETVCLSGKNGSHRRTGRMTRLTRMYGPAVRRKRFRRSGVSGLASMYPVSDWSMCSGPSWYQRACVLISGQVSTDHSGHQCSHALGRPNLHLVSSSRRPRLEIVDRVTSSLAPHIAQLLCSSQGPFLRPGPQNVDRAEHGARIKRVGRLHRRSSSARRRVL